MEDESQVPPPFTARPESQPDAQQTVQPRAESATPALSRKVLFGVLAVLVVAFTAGSVYLGYQVVTTSQVDKLGKAVTEQGAAKAPSVPAIPAAPAAAVPAAPEVATMDLPRSDAAMGAGPSAPPTLPSAEELLAQGTKPAKPAPAPAALVRDLPDWLATEVGGTAPRAAVAPVEAASSGASGDESAESVKERGKDKTPARTAPERASAVFARCPKPGESGAVECRRAVCSGAARKQAACSAYLQQ
ncbi:hypothetical protein [Pseudoduganella buxea]|uniref:Uncharacterized protein n=1 Tax=Pseudoduganella buxea TaxID=1949069 RepID=A0A6I3SYI4_9BURK|nr:hypothetical protein [Pseudoduganella buxea]MTV54164.1 hypothetical protein [Pseudoduganella buxea]GGC15360.1 hypothetical protein GCM10011572_40860 [Pseudoduganella buxea]